MINGLYSSYSPLKVFLRKFFKQKFALFAFFIVLFIVFIGVFGHWIAPFDPYRPVTAQYSEKGIDSEQLTNEHVAFIGKLSDGSTISVSEFTSVKVASENRRVAAVRSTKNGIIVSANTAGTTLLSIESEGVVSRVPITVSSNELLEGNNEVVRLIVDLPEKELNVGEQFLITPKVLLVDGTELEGLQAINDLLLDGEEVTSNSTSGFVTNNNNSNNDKGVHFESLTDVATVSSEGIVTIQSEGEVVVNVTAGFVSSQYVLTVGKDSFPPRLIEIVPEAEKVSLVDIYKHQPPSSLHYFGTDHQNRDIFSRVVYGTKETLMIGFLSVAIGAFIGTSLGLMAGYYGGKLDSIVTRFTDLLLAFPGILLAIAVIAFLGPGLGNIIFALAVFTVPIFVRIVRGSTLALKELTYVEAAKSIGVKDRTIILRHIFPGTLSVVVVYLTMRIGVAILIGAALSFLGLGGDITAPEWGSMLSAAKDNSGNLFHPTFFPGLAIVITVLSFNILGDGLRDALDPKLRE